MASKKSQKIPIKLPILSVSDTVLFPRMVFPIKVENSHTEELVSAIKEMDIDDRIVGLIQAKDDENLYDVGTVVLVVDAITLPDESIKLTLQGLKRFKINALVSNKNYLEGEISVIKESSNKTAKTKSLVKPAIALFEKISTLDYSIPREFVQIIKTIKNPSQVADMIASSIDITNEERQKFLEITNVRKRLEELIKTLTVKSEQVEVGDTISRKITRKAREAMNENQKQYYLRQQLKAIREELGEEDEEGQDEAEEYREKIESANLPEAAYKEATRELKRLKRLHPSSAERSVVTNYLDWLTDMPWDKYTEDKLNVKEASDILDGDHYGLEKPKKRVLEYLAVRKLKPNSQGPVLCFVGPPGTGKTSLGRSIANALGREFIRISLGGVRDEAEIRGHRRTYVGALPGRIIQGIKRAGTSNPVFMLDEIDKLGKDFRGDPSSALLEVLDPEQNFSFSDHYLDVPFDLSKVMFITTANVLETIPPALNDRMEVIRFSGYTEFEKLNIAKQFLIAKQRGAHGLKSNQISFTDPALKKIINDYTYEAGVRNLEREIANICRGVATEIVSEKIKISRVGPRNLRRYLGKEKISPENKVRPLLVGMAPFLFVSGYGGGMGFIESVIFKGNIDDEILLTGQLGEVMQESAVIALNYLRTIKDSKIKIPDFTKNTVHLHIPEGAQPKDGPSAGTALFAAFYSLFTGKKMKKGIALTGEITLKGEVLPVGGIKEKVLAANRSGMTTIILPEWNRRDLDDLPDEVKDKIKFHFVSKALEVLKICFN
jgi:ATP-dependent Lon protease